MLKTDASRKTGFGENECPGCGRKREQWSANAGDGYVKDTTPFCCKACADGLSCSCSSQIEKQISHKPGLQVFEHGKIHSERRVQQEDWTGKVERRLPRASPEPSLS